MVNDPHFRPGTPTYADIDEGPGARLSIGALSRATGVPIETLRTWEARYGFPAPERKPSGHRLYPTAYVERLRRVAEAIARGHRASTVVAATEGQLLALLASTGAPIDLRYDGTALADDELRAYLDAMVALDGDRLSRLLRSDVDRLGLMPFLHTRVIPLVLQVGDAWHSGTLHVRHEHFFTQYVDDLLRALRAPLERDATGPVVVFATLPGEAHSLGLQMAAVVVAERRCRVLYLGTDTPTAEIADAARDIGARAVAISISTAADRETMRAHVGALRQAVPRRVALLVGGAGAGTAMADLPVVHLADFGALAEWASSVSA